MAVRPIQPRELLDLADELAGRGAGAGKPRTIRLRRSISTAYYAVFHEVSFRAVTRLLGTAAWGPTEASVARWVTHTDLEALARAATGSGNQALKLALGQLQASQSSCLGGEPAVAGNVARRRQRRKRNGTGMPPQQHTPWTSVDASSVAAW